MTDKDLRRAVLDELDFDPSLDAGDIGVAVSEGVVTLTGHVGSYAEKVEAERAVRRVRGVRAIAQEIAVRYADAKKVADIGSREEQPLLAVDISISSDDRTLFVDTFMDGKVRVYDIEDPHDVKQIYERKIGAQVNMVSQSWDGKRLYFTSSLLANWDGTGHEDEQFLRAFTWNGKTLEPRFDLDFEALGLGRPHLMRFGQEGFWASTETSAQALAQQE